MKNKYNNEQYKIKVNRISSESERIYPLNQYSKTNYSNSKKIPQKNSILYKLKFNPEIIINEYHQTSNNINTNINIKTNQSENSNINNTSSNNISYMDRGKNSNKYYQENLIENSMKSDDNNSNNYGSYIDKSSNKDKNSKNIDNISYRNNNNENSSSRIFSPFTNEYSTNSRDNDYKKRNVNNIKNMKFNGLNHNNNNINSIFSPREEYNIIKRIQVENGNYTNIDTENSIFSNLEKDMGSQRQRKNNSQEEIKASDRLKYIKRKNPSFNIRSNYNTTNSHASHSSVESLRTRKMKEMNDIVFSSGRKLNNIFRSRFNKKNDNLIVNNTNDNNDNSKDSLNIKLEYYRIKLFKEFFKHFKIFYLSYVGKIFRFFLKKMSFYEIRHRKDYIYSRKSFLRNNNSIENCRNKKENILDINNSRGQNLIEVFKSSTMNDYYKLYKQYKKNKNLDRNIKRILDSYSLNKEKKDLNSFYYQNMNDISSPAIEHHYLNSAPRIYKNLENLSIKRKPENKLLFTSNSKSPSFRIGNKTIINNDISFGVEGNVKEKELFRDTNELKKKYEQIQRRKKSAENRNRDISSENNIDKTRDLDKIKNSEEYNEFSKLRNQIQNLKNNHIKNNIFKISRNNNSLMQMNSLENEINNSIGNNINIINNNENNNEQNDNSEYSKTLHNYSIKNQHLNKREVKENKIKANKEGKNDTLRKNNDGINSKYKFTNINIINKNKTLINDNKINKNEDEQKYKRVKVKVNVHKNLFTKNEKNIIEDKTNKINKNINNYTYRITPSNSKINNSLTTKNNIYYIKRNNINNNKNDDNNIDNKFVSSLIKNINTKDNRIHINIFYYTYSYNKKYPKKKRKRFYGLKKINKTSICLICEMELIKNNLLKFKNKLGSIKEEEISNQNSKIYDENSTLGNNYINDKKNNASQKNELLYPKFVGIIQNIFKKYFMKRIKKLNIKKIDAKKEENNNNDKAINRIYSKRNRYKKIISIKEGS